MKRVFEGMSGVSTSTTAGNLDWCLGNLEKYWKPKGQEGVKNVCRVGTQEKKYWYVVTSVEIGKEYWGPDDNMVRDYLFKDTYAVQYGNELYDLITALPIKTWDEALQNYSTNCLYCYAISELGQYEIVWLADWLQRLNNNPADKAKEIREIMEVQFSELREIKKKEEEKRRKAVEEINEQNSEKTKIKNAYDYLNSITRR